MSERERPEPMGADEVRDRAVGGAAVLGARGVAVYALGIVANIVLARLLEPRDFGIVALGSVLLVVGTYLTDGGLGAALIRRERAPDRLELAAVAGLQLAVALVLALVGAAVAASFGEDGLVVAVMLASLPIAVAKLPATIMLDRRLLYRPIAMVDVMEALTYYVWALVAVALGAGVWGVATAVIVRALVGVAAMVRLGPLGLMRPRWSWPHVRPLVAFGTKLQANALVAIVRDQGLNVAVASIAGIATLGVWSLAYRILQVPLLIVTTASRVSYTAMARLLETSEDPRAAVERSAAALTIAMAAVLVALVGCAPAALPALLGEGWEDVPATLLWASLGMLVSAPVIVATMGYLFAVDRAGIVVSATVWHTVVWLAVAIALLPELGAVAVGIGWVPGGIVAAVIAGRGTARLSGAALLRNLALPVAVAIAAGAAGWLVAASGPETVPWGAAGLVAGELALLAGLALVARPQLADAHALARRAISRSLAGDRGTAGAPVA